MARAALLAGVRLVTRNASPVGTRDAPVYRDPGPVLPAAAASNTTLGSVAP